jgi:hypothetical protein
MVILHAARHRLPVPRLARWMLALGITASLTVNVAQGWSHGLVGAVKLEDLTTRQVQKALAELSASLSTARCGRLCSAPGLRDRLPTGNSSTGSR